MAVVTRHVLKICGPHPEAIGVSRTPIGRLIICNPAGEQYREPHPTINGDEYSWQKPHGRGGPPTTPRFSELALPTEARPRMTPEAGLRHEEPLAKASSVLPRFFCRPSHLDAQNGMTRQIETHRGLTGTGQVH